MSYYNANEVVNGPLESLHSRYQIDFETSMRGNDFIFELVQLLYYNFHKINFKRGGSYIYAPDQIKEKKAIISPINKDDKCFPYALTVALKYEEI